MPTDLRFKKKKKIYTPLPLTKAGFGVCFGDEGNAEAGWR